ncbi:MAG: rhodanese-like domain-containing protein [Bacteroidetes bacterium]|nr:rhodanese-like domain-containing protein [Bacteroidota bacterium]
MNILTSVFKPMQAIMLILTLVACNQPESKYEKLNPAEFNAKLNTLQNNQLIDVRTPEEYQAGHLKNAVNINFIDNDFEELISKLVKKKPVFIHCAAGVEGGRSNQTAKLLEELGFTEIYELEGGITNWINAGMETVP